MGGRPLRRNKDEFSNAFGVVLADPELLESRQHSALFEKPETVNKIIMFNKVFFLSVTCAIINLLVKAKEPVTKSVETMR